MDKGKGKDGKGKGKDDMGKGKGYEGAPLNRPGVSLLCGGAPATGTRCIVRPNCSKSVLNWVGGLSPFSRRQSKGLLHFAVEEALGLIMYLTVPV